MSRANSATRQQFQSVPTAGLPSAKNARRPEKGGKFAIIASRLRILILTMAVKANAPFRFARGFPAGVALAPADSMVRVARSRGVQYRLPDGPSTESGKRMTP